MTDLLAFQFPNLEGWIFIGVIALLLFGKRLPEVGRSLGKGIVEFKKGLAGVEDEMNKVDAQVEASKRLPEAKPQFKFDPYTGKPVETGSETPHQQA